MVQHRGVGDERQDATGQPSTERVSVSQAADHLGTTVDAIRKRVQRGTIPYEKDGDGRVWILLDTGRPRQDRDQDTTGRRHDSGASHVLVEVGRDGRRLVVRLLEAEREAHKEARRIIAGLVQRIPELESPTVPSESPESATAGDEGGGGTPGPERPTERRSWWRRMFK
jgi:hypothetical protein